MRAKLAARGINTHDPLHRRCRRPLHRSGARLHRQARAQRQRREGRRQRGGDQGVDRCRHADRARPAEASISAFLALEEAGDLPQYAAMVHRDGQGHRQARRHAAPSRARRHQGDALGAGAGREPHQRHDRGPPRLGDLAPARLGRADHGVHQGKAGRLGRHPRRSRGQCPHRRGVRGRRRRRLVQARRARALPRQARQRGLAEGRRHSRRLVRFRLDACFRAGRPGALSRPRRHQAQGRRRRRRR